MNDKARKILFDTYWTSAGWRNRPYKTEPNDLAFAISAGYMFEPKTLSHDEVVTWLVNAREVEMRSVADAFLASLSSRRLEWRSALGSYAFSRHFPKHKTVEKQCKVCGQAFIRQSEHREDLSVLNFERFKWGGVRHLSKKAKVKRSKGGANQFAFDALRAMISMREANLPFTFLLLPFYLDPLYAAFDLERFAEMEVEAPREQDLGIVRQIIKAAQQIEGSDSAGVLARKLKDALPSNQDERRVLIEILGICGILQPLEQPKFLHDFVKSADRSAPSHHKNDWSYPVSWWRGRDGVNLEALNFYFPQLKAS